MSSLLEARRVANIGKQVDNAALPAGSPMYYYCRSCGAHVATLPENWYMNSPPKLCDDCRKLDDPGDYDAWLCSRGERPVPR